MLTTAFITYTILQRKYVGFYDTYSKVFEDFLSALDILSNARLAQQIIGAPTLDIYLRVISYDLQKTSTNYQLIFQQT